LSEVSIRLGKGPTLPQMWLQNLCELVSEKFGRGAIELLGGLVLDKAVLIVGGGVVVYDRATAPKQRVGSSSLPGPTMNPKTYEFSPDFQGPLGDQFVGE
jgi:hypothetical protein